MNAALVVVPSVAYGLIGALNAGLALMYGFTRQGGRRVPNQVLASIVLGVIWPLYLIAVLAESVIAWISGEQP